jgi:hypothetical protein
MPLLLGLAAISAQAERIFSRSIMPSCQFVYQVESDVIAEASAETIESAAGATLTLRAQAANSWDREPTLSEEFLLAADESGRVAWTFESMSVSKNYLFRNLSFEWGHLDNDGVFLPLTKRLVADVGRRFGENCLTYRGGDAEFQEREVSEVPPENGSEF